MPRKIPRLLWAALPLTGLLYFYGLGSVGMIGPDEPRYASIARAMARTGDWVTPQLWGQPWFEKPPLLYWMSAGAFRLGLGPDWAPRLPVVLAAVAFLVFFWRMLDREFGCFTARMSTLMLATMAGWVGFSQVGHMDLLLTASFSAAVLLTLPWVSKGDTRLLPWASAMLGIAVLAKSLVPLVLIAPLAIWGRGRWKDLLRLRVTAPFLVIALPWYILCYLRNGATFLNDLFWRQQVERLTSGALLHVRPWWFYAPVVLGLLVPWTPLLALLFRRGLYRETRRAFLLAIVLWGLAFFSIAANKLPGYVLPLLPALAVLMGSALAERPRAATGLLAVCALLLVLYPVAVPLLPYAVAEGISHAPRPAFNPLWLAPLAVALLAWLLTRRERILAAVFWVAAGAAIGTIGLKAEAANRIESMASAESLWRQIAADPGQVCVEEAVDRLDRGWRYGLNYYSGTPLPDCTLEPKPVRIVHSPGKPPQVAHEGG